MFALFLISVSPGLVILSLTTGDGVFLCEILMQPSVGRSGLELCL